MQLNKLKSAIRNETEVILKLPSKIIGNFDDKTNFPHKYLLINRLQIFLNHLQIFYQLISSYQKLSYPKLYSQEDLLVDFLVHY